MATAAPVSGEVFFSLTSGKKTGPFQGAYVSDKDDSYLDVTKGGKGYPTKLDFNKFKTVSGISFKPGMGKQLSWSSWIYYNHKDWAVDRFTNLS